MKYLLGLLLLFCSTIQAQIPKNANTIEVQGVSFKEVVSRLLDKGLHIDKIDSIHQTIKTEPTPITKKSVAMVTMYVRVKDSVTTLSATYQIEGSPDNYTYPVENRGVKGSPLKESFNYLNNIALSISDTVAYKVL